MKLDIQHSPLLEVRDLRKQFVKEARVIDVLKGVNVTFASGESVAIMGRSGAGKSTLLQMLGTLDRPTSGKILFEGHDVFAFQESELAQFRGNKIGFVFQFHHLLPEFTALENAAMPALIARRPRAEAFASAEKILARVGMTHRLSHKPGELSGGEQQRVALARALVMRPRLLLADEPTGNLDDATGASVFELFHELTSEMDVSVVVVTHNSALAARLGRTLIMTDGTLADSHAAVTGGVGSSLSDAAQGTP